jgi:hypothetical protein
MNIYRTIAPLLALCFATSCNDGAGPNSQKDPYLPAFVRRQITLTADADRAVTNRPITITGTCTPLVRGNGRLRLLAWPEDPSDYIILESPTLDTLHRGASIDTSTTQSYIIADFTPNVPVSGQWILRLPANARVGDYSFSASAILDSVFLPDSGKVFWFNDEVVLKSTESGAGYDRIGGTVGILHLMR